MTNSSFPGPISRPTRGALVVWLALVTTTAALAWAPAALAAPVAVVAVLVIGIVALRAVSLRLA